MSAKQTELAVDMWRDVPLTEPVLVWTNQTGWVWCETPEEVLKIVGESNDLRIGFQLSVEEREYNTRVLKDMIV